MVEDTKKKVSMILSDGKLMYSKLNDRYKAGYKEYQRLKKEIRRLEELKNESWRGL